MITAYGDPETKRKAMRAARGLLTKPIDFTLLRQEIDSRLQPGPAGQLHDVLWAEVVAKVFLRCQTKNLESR